MHRMLPLVLGIAVSTCSAVTLPAAAQPRVANGDVQALPGPLTRAALDALAATHPTAWVGYAVPALDGNRRACCWSGNGGGCCQSCALEANRVSGTSITTGSGVARLESAALHVLFRLDQGGIDRVRVFSEDCALDAGGRTIHWVTNMPADESVRLLATFLTPSAPRSHADGALLALAMHRDQAALQQLLATAKDGPSAHVRGQALFWLAQRAGDQAAGAITDAIANDPETEVKKRAVFALSQLPHDEGVPLLMQVARTHSNPAVRRQAMFWLGQSKDPRALEFFREILFKQ